ncbi:PIKK family atypical protein kinase [Tritrichomonas foetus]|uniref:Serine/threonine-protein kinase TOR n=1 Tax=Tritrichomonas foetus TaxID=1144522 RepID=A0A1J4L2I6_9EUKA|nr:PIKK family atypical protein kinase [Tritrichomonas foetus]|eukprot:OHT16180.1 PIKK family atypical protein kinase [Tritrichomonas foetus]
MSLSILQRKLARKIISKYLSIIIKSSGYTVYNIFQVIYQRCVSYLTKKTCMFPNDVLKIIYDMIFLDSTVLENETQEIFSIAISYIESKNLETSSIALEVSVSVSVIDSALFHVQYYPIISQRIERISLFEERITNICNCLKILFKYLPEPLSKERVKIRKMCIEFSRSNMKSHLDSLISLMNVIIEVCPEILLTHDFDCWEIVSSLLFSRDFYKLFLVINQKHPTLWIDHSTEIAEKIISVLNCNSNDSIPALQLISVLPLSKTKIFDTLLDITIKYMFSKDSTQRSIASQALLHLISNKLVIDMIQYLEVAIAIAASDSSFSVRRSIMTSLDNTHYPVLASSRFLDMLSSLLNDYSPQIRSYCYNIFKKMRKYSPISVDIVFRRAIINCMNQMQCSKELLDKVQISESLPSLIAAGQKLISTYSDTLIPVFINLLSNMKNIKSSILNYSYEKQLSLNIMKSIYELIKIDHRLVISYISVLFPMFSKLLTEPETDKIKITIINTLSLYSTQSMITSEVFGYLPNLPQELVKILGSSQSTILKIKVLKFLGRCGAILPSQFLESSQKLTINRKNNNLYSKFMVQNSNRTFSGDFYGKIIFRKLQYLMNDSTLSHIRSKCIQTIVNCLSVMQVIPIKCIRQIIPVLIDEKDFNLLQQMVLITKQLICPFIPNIVNLVITNWYCSNLVILIHLITSIVVEVRTDFSDFVSQLIPNILEALSASFISNISIATSCIHLISIISPLYPNLSSLLFPALCKIISSDNASKTIKLTTLNSLCHMIQRGDPYHQTTSIFYSVLDLCICPDHDIQFMACQVLFSLMIKIKSSINLYAHRIIDVLKSNQEASYQFYQIYNNLNVEKNPNFVTFESFPFIQISEPGKIKSVFPHRVVFDPSTFINCFNVDTLISDKQWVHWYHRTVLECIRICPYAGIGCCHDFATQYEPFASFLFFPAFLCCWKFIDDHIKIIISEKITIILHHKMVPNQILQNIARLCDMMERAEQSIFLNEDDYADLCIRTRMLSLSLHFEQEKYFDKHCPNKIVILKKFLGIASTLSLQNTIESIINNLLKKNAPNNIIKELSKWQQPMSLLTNKHNIDQSNIVHFISSCKSSNHFDWIIEKSSIFHQSSRFIKAKLSSSFAEAFFFHKNFKMMNYYSKFGQNKSIKAQILAIISMISIEPKEFILQKIDETYEKIVQKHSSKFLPNYSGIYEVIVNCQILHELTTIVKGTFSKQLFRSRLLNCVPSYSTLWKCYKVYSLVYPDDNTLKYRILDKIIHERRFTMYESTLKLFFPDDKVLNTDSILHLTFLKYKWFSGHHEWAFLELEKCIMNNKPIPLQYIYTYIDWSLTLYLGTWNVESLKHLLQLLNDEILKGNKSVQINQKLGIINYNLYNLTQNDEYAINSIRGFAITINNSSIVSFADLAQLTSLFYRTVTNPSILSQTEPLYVSIHCIKLVESIPQIIAQINKTSIATRTLIDLSKYHIQQILFPLLVATDSSIFSSTATEVLQKACLNRPDLLIEGRKIRTVLISAAITLFEEWVNATPEMLNDLMILVDNPQCNLDRIFLQVNYQLIQKIKMSKNEIEVMNIFLEIQHNCELYLIGQKKIKLSDISPNNVHCFDTPIYVPGQINIFIKSLSRYFTILESKQRPRILKMRGSNGEKYKFLLKSNEDLMLDQRVMQFFNLINAYARRTTSLSSKNGAFIRTYSITPLSSEIGLIHWVEGSDTIYSLISEYRRNHNIDEWEENTYMKESSITNIDSLRSIQRLEFIKDIFSTTNSDDLRKIFWLKSYSSDEWLEKIQRFPRSLAIMSIVGYILGLGDRHPSNIMIERTTCDVIHIDFGDCFDVAQNRILFPENVPFRLTKMIINAFGIGGIDADFRLCCNDTMIMIREHRNSISSVLEMFINEINENEVPYSDSDNINIDLTLKHIWNKMNGTGFDDHIFEVSDQIEDLIKQSTNEYNLSCLYSGWAPMW